MDMHKQFSAFEKTLIFYAGKPIINHQNAFLDDCSLPKSFDDAIAFTLKIWEERTGGLQVINWSSPENLSVSENIIFLNAPAEDTDIETGKYYYELAYIIAGGYEVLITYGQAIFI